VLAARVVTVHDQSPAEESLEPDLEARLLSASVGGMASAVFG
jgi:hypothetical protein